MVRRCLSYGTKMAAPILEQINELSGTKINEPWFPKAIQLKEPSSKISRLNGTKMF